MLYASYDIQAYLHGFNIGDKSLSEILGVSGTDKNLLSKLRRRKYELRRKMDLVQINIEYMQKKIIKLKEAYRKEYNEQHSIEYVLSYG